jgi:hypothetical protein
MITEFQVGRTYATRSICDSDCIYSFTVLARTAKQVTVEVHGKTVRRGLSIWNNVEQFKPFGNYSMCAIISADDAQARDPRKLIEETNDAWFGADR